MQVPPHRIQIDAKFMNFSDEAGRKIRRFHYTPADDATRIRAPKTCDRHDQAIAMKWETKHLCSQLS
jgi:hypothetical protein